MKLLNYLLVRKIFVEFRQADGTCKGGGVGVTWKRRRRPKEFVNFSAPRRSASTFQINMRKDLRHEKSRGEVCYQCGEENIGSTGHSIAVHIDELACEHIILMMVTIMMRILMTIMMIILMTTMNKW